MIRAGETIDITEDEERELELHDADILLLGDAERPVRIIVHFGEEPDDARIVSLRKVDDLQKVEETVGADRAVLAEPLRGAEGDRRLHRSLGTSSRR